jgi:CheY-like chemotaxis protein
MDGRPLVLVVDDDEDTRAAMQDLLESEGYDVEVASDGASAVRRLRTAPVPELLLLDLRMPGVDGRAVIDEIESSADLPEVPIVLMTASSPGEGTSVLPYPLLRKPVTGEAFLRVVVDLCPRLWDAHEPPTAENSEIRGLFELSDTTRDRCSACRERRASVRCSGCGEAYCRACYGSGAGGRCTRCGARASS